MVNEGVVGGENGNHPRYTFRSIIAQSALTVAPNFAIKFFNRSGELVFCPLRAIKVLPPTGRSVVDHARPEDLTIFNLLSQNLCEEAQGTADSIRLRV
jgi:hypothetical protein